MKTFAIFPTICIFVATASLLKIEGQLGNRKVLLWSVSATLGLGGIFTIFSVELFFFLYYFNFISVIIIIPCLISLINKSLPKVSGAPYWLRLAGIGLAATIVTVLVFAGCMFLSLASNPMDRAMPKAELDPNVIEIRSVSPYIETERTVLCSELYNYFGDNVSKRQITEKTAIENFLRQLKNLKKDSTRSGLDARAKVLIKYKFFTDTLCTDRFSLTYRGNYFKMDDQLQRVIWPSVDSTKILN